MMERRRKRDIALAVREGITLALRDFYHPPVPDPEVKVGNVKATSFYITEGDWRVHINVKDVPPLEEEELVAFFRSVCRHELGHYVVCPYDVGLSALITGSASKEVGPELAGFVANFFSDLIVDYYIFERHPEETVWEKKITINWVAKNVGAPSELWMVLVRCYEKMWKVKLAEELRATRIVEEAASRIVRTIRRGGVLSEDGWPTKARRVAKVLKPLLEELKKPGNAEGEYMTSPTGKRVFIPEDVARTMRRNPLSPPLRKEGGCERAAAKYVEKGEKLKDFVDAARAAGLASGETEILRAWYRAKANMRIKVKIRSTRRRGAELQVYPDVWRIEDPVEELDIPLSFQTFPKLIPGVTTKKWVKASGEVAGGEEAPPDMLIVLDSSGSMGWRSDTPDDTPFDLALVAAFSALKFAMSGSCKVAAINFSDRVIVCGWTRERVKVENTLLKYQGGGTVLPVRNIVEVTKRNGMKALILLITDAEISNWDEAVEELGRLVDMGHCVCMFFIGGSPCMLGERYKKFVSAGGKIYFIPSVKELPDVVIEEVKRYYR